jgi:hypothetical protein
MTAHPEVILLVQTPRPSAIFAPRACHVSLNSGFYLERLLEVFGVNACLGAFGPSHRRSLRAVHLDELDLSRVSGESEEACPLGNVSTSRLAAGR